MRLASPAPGHPLELHLRKKLRNQSAKQGGAHPSRRRSFRANRFQLPLSGSSRASEVRITVNAEEQRAMTRAGAQTQRIAHSLSLWFEDASSNCANGPNLTAAVRCSSRDLASAGATFGSAFPEG